ncbi:MAG: hypothetical protein GY906_30505, partial [bacterium]|nr:hypothetical protein [bacterium]
MRKSAMVGVLCLFVLTLVVPGELLAQEKKSSKELKLEAKQVEVDEVAEATLKRLFKENARAKELFDAAMAWAVFDNTKIAFGVSGGGGKGVAVEKDSGQRTYMKMGTAGVGFGIGVNKYQVVFFFQDEAIAKSFVEKGWQADAGATAAAGKDA